MIGAGLEKAPVNVPDTGRGGRKCLLAFLTNRIHPTMPHPAVPYLAGLCFLAAAAIVILTFANIQ